MPQKGYRGGAWPTTRSQGWIAGLIDRKTRCAELWGQRTESLNAMLFRKENDEDNPTARRAKVPE